MYARKPKIPKRESIDEGWYTILNHTGFNRSQWNTDGNLSLEYYQVASIDPATDNFALRIERWWLSGNNKGKVTPLVFIKTSFKAVDPTNTNLMYLRAVNFLSQYINDFIGCHFIVSERQLHVNYKALRISTFVLALIINWCEGKGNLPIIIEVSPKLKYYQLEAPRGWNDKQLKTVWTPEKALEILKIREDVFSIGIIEKSKKKDDYSDTVIQVEALFKLLQLIPNFIVKLTIKKEEEKKEEKNEENKEAEGSNKSEGKRVLLKIKAQI